MRFGHTTDFCFLRPDFATAMFGRRLDFLGGVILIGVGTMILVEHLRAG